jgi:hypothetical protein
LASSGETVDFVLVTERVRLFSAPHPRHSVIRLVAGVDAESVGTLARGSAGDYAKERQVRRELQKHGRYRASDRSRSLSIEHLEFHGSPFISSAALPKTAFKVSGLTGLTKCP